jgi:glutamate/tyrosine decarboxylase-like PLP-dependent enzyme
VGRRAARHGRRPSHRGPERLFAIVTTAGTTNAGVIDDLAGVADVCKESDVWMHVDGAYGGAGLAAPSVRDRYRGIEHADTLVVDPHKWLFAPFDCCALVYRDPEIGRAAHTQHAEYLDVLHAESRRRLGRPSAQPQRPRPSSVEASEGLAVLVQPGDVRNDAYRDAIETTLAVTHEGAKLIADSPHLELIMEPELSTLVFRRVGWNAGDYTAWSDRMLDDGIAFVTPTSWNGEVVLRLCIVNPLTSIDDLGIIVDSLA